MTGGVATWLVVFGCGGDKDGTETGLDTGSGIPITTATEGESLDDDGEEIFDVGEGEASASGGDCPGGDGGMPGEGYGLIWIANSPESTVSKIDTSTGVELARYWSGPSEGSDDPSRTSVNLAGDVAVANRHVLRHDRRGAGTGGQSTGRLGRAFTP